MSYARARLWVGITGVGFWVLVAVLAIAWQLPSRILPTQPVSPIAEASWLLLVFLGYALLSLPSDLLGGHVLPRLHGRSSQSFLHFGTNWIRGAAYHLFGLWAISLALLWSARTGGLIAVTLVALLGFAVLLAAQGRLARLLGGMQIAATMPRPLVETVARWSGARPNLAVWEHRDSGFTGGVTGLPGREQLVLPAGWNDEFGVESTAVHAARRVLALQDGARRRGIVVAALWNLSGLLLATRLPGADLESVAGLVTVACGSTLWSFLGLLLLPSVSRPAVIRADRAVQGRGVPGAAMHTALGHLDRLQDDEPSRSAWIERVFHPVPSLENRLSSLGEAKPSSRGAWQAARLALFLSWGTLGLLSRAVHCNAGRPELWVLLPSD